ncbi:aromatic ring-hydroxylating dioxygenase subunit alpha [Emcibacter sp.]|uniref:aromatic ring-hydroxylating oxygenase subunit alpha n=1 Tax=Emcibacter sp. TaxID=1979954 RepID=UPI002AA72237|nr:aromatic ring-hydroxylating dioxygenase subunit alpha [Emcibacter sp.]
MTYVFPDGWVVNPDAPRESSEQKAPYIDNGTDLIPPQKFYDHEFRKLEEDRLWPNVWILAGVTSDIPEDGDYFTFELGKESFVIVRTEEMEIKAFYNVCPHRGNRIALNERGSVGQFTCAFHSWQFDLDGNNTRITDRETFRPEVLCADASLTKVHCEVYGGLIFIHMGDNPPSLKEYLGPLADYIPKYHVEDMHVVRHTRVSWAANWKTGLDAFYETYHLHAIHPETADLMGDKGVQFDLYPNGMSRMIVPIGEVTQRREDRETVNDSLIFLMKEAGMSEEEFPDNALDVRRAIQKAKRRRAEKLGMDYSELVDGQLTDSWATGIFPNVQIGMHPEGIFIMRFLPHATDPNIMYYDTMTLFRPADDPDYTVPAWMGLPEGTDVSGETRPDCEYFPLGSDFDLGLVLNQDTELIPVVHAGLQSRGFRGQILSEQELRIRHFHRELDRYINGDK